MISDIWGSHVSGIVLCAVSGKEPVSSIFRVQKSLAANSVSNTLCSSLSLRSISHHHLHKLLKSLTHYN